MPLIDRSPVFIKNTVGISKANAAAPRVNFIYISQMFLLVTSRFLIYHSLRVKRKLQTVH